MYNCIFFYKSAPIWITQQEADDLSQQLIDGKSFVKLNRLNKTFNASSIADIGSNLIFNDPLVQGGQFSFTYYTVYAKNGEKEYRWQNGWKLARGEFGIGIPFNDFITSQTIT